MPKAKQVEKLKTKDGTVEVVLYDNDHIRLSVVRGVQYVIKGIWMGPKGGNITLKPDWAGR